MAVARLIRTIAGLVAAVIVVGILLWVLSANPHNTIVSDIHDAGRWLVGPFANVFSIHSAKWNLAANWGLAAAIYLVVGHAIASVVARAATPRRFGRPSPVA